jgi:hypothetical protein
LPSRSKCTTAVSQSQLEAVRIGEGDQEIDHRRRQAGIGERREAAGVDLDRRLPLEHERFEGRCVYVTRDIEDVLHGEWSGSGYSGGIGSHGFRPDKRRDLGRGGRRRHSAISRHPKGPCVANIHGLNVDPFVLSRHGDQPRGASVHVTGAHVVRARVDAARVLGEGRRLVSFAPVLLDVTASAIGVDPLALHDLAIGDRREIDSGG